MELAGIAAVVTGAASGLGEATAKALIGAGARVALCDRDEPKVRAVAAAIGGRAYPMDVTDDAGAAAALAQAAADLGVARVVVNCAGVAKPARILGRGGPHSLADFEQVVRINLVGTFNVMRLTADAISKTEPLAGGERGVIVNTASVGALEGQVGQASYAASKAGVAAMTLPAARELARLGIRVMTIAPGIFATPMMGVLSEEAQKALAADVPFPSRLGRPEEYADLVLQIVANPMLNGEVIRLDGALRLGLG